MKARRHKRETFEKVELEDVEKVDEVHVHGWPWNVKDDCKRRVDLQVPEHEFDLTRLH